MIDFLRKKSHLWRKCSVNCRFQPVTLTYWIITIQCKFWREILKRVNRASIISTSSSWCKLFYYWKIYIYLFDYITQFRQALYLICLKFYINLFLITIRLYAFFFYKTIINHQLGHLPLHTRNKCHEKKFQKNIHHSFLKFQGMQTVPSDKME